MKEAWFQQFLFLAYGMEEILTLTLQPCMSKLGLHSQGNPLKQAKFLRQPRTDGY